MCYFVGLFFYCFDTYKLYLYTNTFALIYLSIKDYVLLWPQVHENLK